MDWTKVIFAMVGVIFSAVIVPLAKRGWALLHEKIKESANSTNKTVLDSILSVLDTLIVKAEKKFTESGRGTEKKAWVLSILKSAGLLTDDNEDFIGTIIDGLCDVLTSDGYINTDKTSSESTNSGTTSTDTSDTET